VAIEIFGSIAAARACSASTSGWSSASDSTRAMTRRCSVILSPRSAHKASRSIGWCKSGLTRNARTPRYYGSGEALLQPGAGLFGRLLVATAMLARLATEADFLRQHAPLFGVIRRDHRIVGRETPAGAVLGRSQSVVGHQVTLEHLHLLAVFEADDVVILDRCTDRDRGFGFGLDLRSGAETGECAVDVLDQRRDFLHPDAVVADMSGDDVGRKRDQRLRQIVFDSGH